MDEINNVRSKLIKKIRILEREKLRLGVFGGSFDPIHIAHLIIVEQMRDELQLDRVLLIPSARPPHKDLSELTEPQTRFEMVKLAIAGNPYLEVSDIELKKPGISYTVETLKLLADKFNLDHDHLFLLIGYDSLIDMPNWYQPQKIFELASVVIVNRPSNNNARPQSYFLEKAVIIKTPLMSISSSEIRQRVMEHKSIKYLVPPVVEKYIYDNKLYQNG